MSSWTINESAGATAVQGVLNYLDKDPDRCMSGDRLPEGAAGLAFPCNSAHFVVC